MFAIFDISTISIFSFFGVGG